MTHTFFCCTSHTRELVCLEKWEFMRKTNKCQQGVVPLNVLLSSPQGHTSFCSVVRKISNLQTYHQYLDVNVKLLFLMMASSLIVGCSPGLVSWCFPSAILLGRRTSHESWWEVFRWGTTQWWVLEVHKERSVVDNASACNKRTNLVNTTMYLS